VQQVSAFFADGVQWFARHPANPIIRRAKKKSPEEILQALFAHHAQRHGHGGHFNAITPDFRDGERQANRFVPCPFPPSNRYVVIHQNQSGLNGAKTSARRPRDIPRLRLIFTAGRENRQVGWSFRMQ